GRPYGSCLEQFGDALERIPRPSNHGSERCHIIAIGFWRLRAGSDEGRPATRLEYREGLLRDITADSVANGIATRHNLREILRIVVDDVIGTQVTHIVTIRSTRSRDHTCTDVLCKLNGETGDASCTALNQNGFTGSQLQRCLDGTQRGKASKRHS